MFKYIKTNKFFFICVSIIFIASFLASLIQTSFGAVDIKLKQLKTDDGQTLVYDLYKPKSADVFNKVPFIVVVPGVFIAANKIQLLTWALPLFS